MVDLKELWIGDMVRLIKSNRIGKFEGIHKNGKARVLVHHEIILSTAANLRLLTEKELKRRNKTNFDLDLTEEPQDKKTSPPSSNSYHSEPEVLDLHLETLDPLFTESQMLSALDYQLNCCEDFIYRSIQAQNFSARIIHGKGRGILKREVLTLINSIPQILSATSSLDGGAIEIIFSY